MKEIAYRAIAAAIAVLLFALICGFLIMKLRTNGERANRQSSPAQCVLKMAAVQPNVSESLDGLCAKLAKTLQPLRGDDAEILGRDALICADLSKIGQGDWVALFNRASLQEKRSMAVGWKVRSGAAADELWGMPDTVSAKIVDFTIVEERRTIHFPGAPFYFKRSEAAAEVEKERLNVFSKYPESFESLERRAKDAIEAENWVVEGERTASVEVFFDKKKNLWRLSSDENGTSEALARDLKDSSLPRKHPWNGRELCADEILGEEQASKGLLKFRDGWRLPDPTIKDKTQNMSGASAKQVAAAAKGNVPRVGYLVENPKSRTFVSLDKRLYKNVKILFVAPDGIDVRHERGVKFEAFSNLPQRIRDEFDYDMNEELAYLRWKQEMNQEALANLAKEREASAIAARNAIAAESLGQQASSGGAKEIKDVAVANPKKAVVPGSPDFEQMEQRIRRRDGAPIDISNESPGAPKDVDLQLQGGSLTLRFKDVSTGMRISRKGVRPLIDPIVVVDLPGAVLEGSVLCNLRVDSMDQMARDLVVKRTLYIHGELEAVNVEASQVVFIDIASELKALAFYKSHFGGGIGIENSSAFACFDSCKFEDGALLSVTGRRRKIRFNLSNSEVGASLLLGQLNPANALVVKQAKPSSRSAALLGLSSQLSIYSNHFMRLDQEDLDSVKETVKLIAKDNSFQGKAR